MLPWKLNVFDSLVEPSIFQEILRISCFLFTSPKWKFYRFLVLLVKLRLLILLVLENVSYKYLCSIYSKNRWVNKNIEFFWALRNVDLCAFFLYICLLPYYFSCVTAYGYCSYNPWTLYIYLFFFYSTTLNQAHPSTY